MKLKDLKKGDKFMFTKNDILTEIYEVKGKAKGGYVLVGLPGAYDVFASAGEKEVIV